MNTRPAFWSVQTVLPNRYPHKFKFRGPHSEQHHTHYSNNFIGHKLKLKTGHLYGAFSWELASKALSMARVNEGLHSFTCHPYLYTRMESAILPLFPAALWPVLISRPTEGREGRRLSWPGWLVTYRGSNRGMPAPKKPSPSQYQPTDTAAVGDRTHDHWRRQLWCTGACAPPLTTVYLFQCSLTCTKSLTATICW